VSENTSKEIQRVAELAGNVRQAVEHALLGQREAIEALLAGYMAGGHVLLEGVPGIGKTLLARAFAASLGVAFARVQFTPDLMPADIIGTNVFEPASGSFRLVRGPVFTDVLMADEVNRTPPKTQSALLEAMQEKQVTIDGTAYPLAEEFTVVATQNPIEFEGTYPLPEAQLDRFLLRIAMRPPAREAELVMLRQAAANTLAGWSPRIALPAAVVVREDIAAMRNASRLVHVDDAVLDYVLRLAEAIRSTPRVELPVSPRGVLALMEASRGVAIIEGREFVVPDDVRRMLVPCWGHRILLTAESELEQHTTRSVLEGAAAAVEVPH
jgi:MoxR-like ATPase